MNPVSGNSHYVAPGGSDSGPGTEAHPWATFAKAVLAVESGDTVYVRQGLYKERLIINKSGSAGAPITFRSYPGETATIDGTPITDTWCGVIEVSGASYIRIVGFTVINALNDAAIWAHEFSHLDIEGNSTSNSKSSGIRAWSGDNLTVERNDVDRACSGGEGFQECISVADTDTFSILHNSVHDGYM
jgi:hypothetical protein